MNKNKIVFLAVIFLIVTLTSCRSNDVNVNMTFFDVYSSLYLSSEIVENELTFNNIYIYGNTEHSIEYLNAIKTIHIYDKNKKELLISQQINIVKSEEAENNLFYIQLSLDEDQQNLFSEKQAGYISIDSDKNLFYIGDCKIESTKISNYDVISIIEMPTIIPEENKALNLSYYIALKNSTNNVPEIEVDILGTKLNISNIDCTYDLEYTYDLISNYKGEKSIEEINQYKVYQINFNLIVDENLSFVIKPKFIVHINNLNLTIIPPSPCLRLIEKG